MGGFATRIPINSEVNDDMSERRFELHDGRRAIIRSVKSGDLPLVLRYFADLSTESKTTFRPHPFDKRAEEVFG